MWRGGLLRQRYHAGGPRTDQPDSLWVGAWVRGRAGGRASGQGNKKKSSLEKNGRPAVRYPTRADKRRGGERGKGRGDRMESMPSHCRFPPHHPRSSRSTRSAPLTSVNGGESGWRRHARQRGRSGGGKAGERSAPVAMVVTNTAPARRPSRSRPPRPPAPRRRLLVPLSEGEAPSRALLRLCAKPA